MDASIEFGSLLKVVNDVSNTWPPTLSLTFLFALLLATDMEIRQKKKKKNKATFSS
jgi:hypothetical protein